MAKAIWEYRQNIVKRYKEWRKIAVFLDDIISSKQEVLLIENLKEELSKFLINRNKLLVKSQPQSKR